MNIKFDFTETGGLPLDQDVLNDLQNGILEAEKISSILGPLVILSGCIVTGGNAGNGLVAINGEVMPFVGGLISAKIIIVEAHANMSYFDGVLRPSQITRVATFGDDGVTTLLWADFKRSTTGLLAEIESLNSDVALLGADIVTLETEVTALQSTTVKKLASGTETLGDADTNHSDTGTGTSHVIYIGKTLDSINYQVLLTVVSKSFSSQSDLFHHVVVRDKALDRFTVYFRESANYVQNIDLDWTLIAL